MKSVCQNAQNNATLVATNGARHNDRPEEALTYDGAIENRKWKLENGNGNRNGQNLMQMNVRVKPLNDDHLLKITSIQRPHSN